MNPRAQVVAIVAAAAVIVAGTSVAITLATRTDTHRGRANPPPLATDPTAARAIVRQVREALAAWPSGTVRRLRILAAEHPRSGLIRLELGVALAVGGDAAGGRGAWRDAKRVDPDSPSAVRADDLLHPGTPRGKPPFVPSFARPQTQVERLLARGVELQAALRPVSAERAFAAAARAAPNDPEALAAAAVGLYDKDRPALAFSQLGPLARRFPHAQTVRFHLGLLLIYVGDLPKARQELALAVRAGPRTRLAKEARTLLRAAGKR